MGEREVSMLGRWLEDPDLYFGGFWQESYCFPSIINGTLYYSKRSRLVLENLVANEAENWRLNYYNPAATVKNNALPIHRKWQVVGTTVIFSGVRNRDSYSLAIEVHMTDPNAQQEYEAAVGTFLLSINMMLVAVGVSPIMPDLLWSWTDMLIAEAEMKIAEIGMIGMFDTYLFKWAPGDGDYSLWNVPIYRILEHD